MKFDKIILFLKKNLDKNALDPFFFFYSNMLLFLISHSKVDKRQIYCTKFHSLGVF